MFLHDYIHVSKSRVVFSLPSLTMLDDEGKRFCTGLVRPCWHTIGMSTRADLRVEISCCWKFLGPTMHSNVFNSAFAVAEAQYPHRFFRWARSEVWPLCCKSERPSLIRERERGLWAGKERLELV